ncbi:MAG: M48 family metallopeptidase [Anaerolineaceae bacterium]
MKICSNKADEIIYSCRKHLAISVLPGGRVLVRAPLRTSPARIEAFLNEQSDWIDQARVKMSKVALPSAPYQFQEGELIWFLGKQYPLHLVESVPGSLSFEPGKGFLLERGQHARAAKLLTSFYKEETRRRVTTLVKKYAQSEGFRPTGIRITSAKTRWGSCSAKNSLNFSYRLVMTPPDCLEYVVVHELVHTRVRNHSGQFWGQVQQILPDYKQQRRWLKQNGIRLPEG